jgi:acyl transferase domain-containing protein
MLSGGVSRPDPLFTQMGFSQLRALSKRGICSPFDAAGDGLVVGEGPPVPAKRTEDAVAHGDRIYGVIRGIGLANDGWQSARSPCRKVSCVPCVPPNITAGSRVMLI